MSNNNSKKDEGLSNDEYDTLHEDIDQAVKKGNDQHGYGGPQKLSVSEGIRAPKGHYLIIGQIATVSSVYKMVSPVNLKCSGCNNEWQTNYRQKPRIEVPSADGFHCTSCNNEEASVTVIPEWISTMDIQLQDTEKFNNIERLPTKFFEQDTVDVRAGEIVSVIGDIDVTRKNEGNGSGKYINMFYSQSIEYARRDKVELTDEAAREMQRWRDEQGSNILGALVERFAPIVVGHEFVKKSLLIAAANAGIKNNRNRAPQD